MADGTDCAAGWATPTRGNRSSSTATARSPTQRSTKCCPPANWWREPGAVTRGGGRRA